MKRTSPIIILIVFAWLAFWFVLGPMMASAQDKAMFYEKSRNTPEVVLIRKALSDTAQVCAEPIDGGIVACRSVADFRKWVKSPAPAGAPLIK